MTAELATVTALPVDHHSYRHLGYLYHCPPPAPGSIDYTEHCIEDQLRLVYDIHGDSDTAWDALEEWNPALTREQIDALFDAADTVYAASVPGAPKDQPFYTAVDNYVDALNALAKTVRAAFVPGQPVEVQLLPCEATS